MSMLLIGGMLYSTGCTDYASDIEDLNQKVDDLEKELVEGQINPLKTDLESVKKALEDAIAAGNAKIAENKEAIDALKAVDAQHDAAIKEAKDAIAAAVVELEALKGQLAELEDKHDADIKAVYDEIAKQVAEVNAKIAAAVERIAANEEAISALKEKDAELAKAIEEAQAAIAANAEDIDENAKAIAANAAAIDENAKDIEALQTDLIGLTDQFNAYTIATDAAIKTLEGRVAAAETAIDTLEGNVEELYTLHDNQNLLIENLDGRLEELAQYTQDQLDLLAEADLALQTLIEILDTKVTNLENSFIDYQKIVNEQFEKAYADIAKNTQLINDLTAKHNEEVAALQAQDAAILQTLDRHAAWMVELEENLADVAERLGTAEDFIAKIQANIAQMQVTIDALTKDLAELETTVADFQKQMDEQIARLDGAIDAALAKALEAAKDAEDAAKAYTDELQKAVENELAAIKTTLDQLSTYATSIEQKIDEYKESNDKVIEGLKGDIAEILNRVQSIVFVPEYADGKGTINWATFGNRILEGRSVLVYQVYPAYCAAAIANAPAVGDVVSPLSFDMTDALKTRGGLDKAPQMNIVGVEGDAQGRLYVTVEARNFGEKFYAGEVEYAASLVLTTENENLASCYTNLVALSANKVEAIKMRAMATDDVTLTAVKDDAEFVDVTGNKVVYTNELTYADIENNPDFIALPGYYLEFNYNGEWYTKYELLAEYGIEVGEIKSEWSVKGAPMFQLLGKANRVLNETTGYTEINADFTKASDKLVGVTYSWNYQYYYPGSDEQIYFGADLKIVAEQRTVNVGEFTETWTYSLDARGDAGMDSYSRNITTTEKVFDGKELPEGVTLADVINGDKEPQVVVTDKDGKVVENVITTITAKDDEVAIYFANFAWDEQYDVVAKYGVLNASGIASMEVNVKFTVNTVDRSRQRIDVNLEASDVEFRSNLVLTNEISNGIGEIYEKLTTDHSNIDVEKDVWFQQNMIADKYTSTCKLFVDGATEAIEVDYNNQDWGTMLLIDEAYAAGQAVYTAYNYNNLDIIPEKITYVKTVKTWYGQEIVITKDVNFLFPTIEDIDFKHTNFVSLVNGIYQSKVHPQYDSMLANPAKPSDPIYNFDTQKVNMNAAFDLVVDNKFVQLGLEDGKAHTTNYDLVAEFMLENKDADGNPIVVDGKPELVNEYQGVTISGNSIKYNAKPKYVDVYGQLYLTNDNGAKYRLVTSFDDTAKYSTYRVYQFDPITEPEDAYETIPVANSQTYTVNLFKYVDVYDYRDGYPTYPLFDKQTGSYVMGNDANGFNTGYTSGDVYGIQFTWSAEYTSDDPEISTEEIAKFIDDSNLATQGVIVFDNSHELNLVKPIRVKATLNVSTVWSDHDVDVYITFAQQKGNVEE